MRTRSFPILEALIGWLMATTAATATTAQRRHHPPSTTSIFASDMSGLLPRSWSETDGKSPRKPVTSIGGNRILNSALGRRFVLPVVRFLWPCTPRKVVRNGSILCLLLVGLVLALEILGRVRINGYLVSTSADNGLMGFYHEMDVDMQALAQSSQLPHAKLYPASAVNQREIKAWMAERRRRTNGRKFLVGCSADWKGYVLRSFLHLFDGLKNDHGWSDLVTDNPLDYFYRQDPKKAPSVLFFCLNSFHYPFYLFLDHNKYFQELRALGTLIVVWSDDLQYFDQFNAHVVRERILKRTDVLLGSYSYMTDDYFAGVSESLSARDMPVLAWLPHSAGPDFVTAPMNEHPINKILLSGKLGASWYPLRHWLGEFQKQHPELMDVYKHAGYYVADNQSEIYASYLRAYRVGVTTTLIHQFLVAKLFEIPATGALMLVNSDLAPLLEALGLREMEHYVAFDRSDPAPTLWWTLATENQAEVDAIRRAGMQQVRDQHMVSHRVQALEQFLTEGVVSYAFPATLRITSPCPSIAYSSEAACEKAFQWNARHKCDLWLCGLRSFRAHM